MLFGGHTIKAHRLAFLYANGRWPSGLCLHRCDNPPCCNPSHLFEGTSHDNTSDAQRKGRLMRGERHWCARLTEADVKKILSDDRPQRMVAAEFGVTKTTIGCILSRKTWAHVGAVLAAKDPT